MTDLFAALYLDEDVDVLVAEILRSRGFDVLTTLGAQQLGGSDRRQLEYAASAGRVFITHNRVDFERLAQEYFQTARPHSGIIVAVRRPHRELSIRLLRLLDRMSRDEMRNQIVYV
jgi:hypothetical protein